MNQTGRSTRTVQSEEKNVELETNWFQVCCLSLRVYSGPFHPRCLGRFHASAFLAGRVAGGRILRSMAYVLLHYV